jgi:hypothetical protein
MRLRKFKEIKHHFSGNARNYRGMRRPKSYTDGTELRRERRYLSPTLDVAIGDWIYHSLNWSMAGVLLDGICQDIGMRVRGTLGLSGSRDIMPFAATVIRVDPELGSCAICFEDPRAGAVEQHENVFADQLH